MNIFFSSNLENKPVLKICIAVFIALNAVVLAILVFGPDRLFAAGSGGNEAASSDSTLVTVNVEPGNEHLDPYDDDDEHQGSRSDEGSSRASSDRTLPFSDDRVDREDMNDGENFNGGDDRDSAYAGTGRFNVGDESESADTAGTGMTSEYSSDNERTSATAPVLVLTDDHVTLHVGDFFNFYDYIETMRDRDGSDLSHYIHLTGNVNTYIPGDYLIVYQITSPVSGETTSKDLLVTVE